MFTGEEIALLENPSLLNRQKGLGFTGGEESQLDLNLNTTANHALRGTVKTCPERWIVVSCSCKPTLVQSGCMSRNCEKCADFVKRRAGSRVEARLMHDKDYFDPVLKTIFTVPPHLYEKFSDRKVWRRTLRKIVAMLKNTFGFLFGLEASHPTGDDLDVFKPHANFLWRQRPGFRAKLDLTLLREKWREILNIGKDAKLATPHHEFILTNTEEGLNKLSHSCAYTVRPFPGWSHWAGSIRWYGKYPRRPKLKQDNRTCPACGDSFDYLGAATSEEITMFKEREWAFHLMYPPDYKPTRKYPDRRFTG